MKYFSFKILAVSIILPPLLYMLSISFIENWAQQNYSAGIESIYTGDTDLLLEGRMSLPGVMAVNIDQFLESRTLVELGLDVDVTVRTKSGQVLYPPVDDVTPYDFEKSEALKVAQNNLKLLNDGLVLDVDVALSYNTPLAYLVVAFYILITVGLLYCYYYITTKKFLQENLTIGHEMVRLKRLEQEYDKKFKSLETVKRQLAEELAGATNQLNNASKNEDGMLEEIITLEKRIEEENERSIQQKNEIDELTEELNRLTALKKSKKKKGRDYEFALKRFKVLYNHLIISSRAMDSYLDYENELQIKSEEVLKNLNDDPDKVKIKRKVFGPKGSKTAFEVVFGYKGRLYYRKLESGKIEILALGTKNTQSKELEFLRQL